MKIKHQLLLIFSFITTLVFSQTGAEIDRTLTISGNTYKYRIYVPTSYDGTKPVPLLFNIHGFTGSNTQQESFGDFRKIADTANFIIIHPDAKNNSASWDVLTGNASSSNGDRKALLTMLDTMEARYNINKCKVYTTGFSQGGFMSCYLVSNLDALGSPPRFAAAAPVAGNYGNATIWNARNPQNPVPLMIIHGTSDGIIGYPGTGGITSSTHVDTVIKWWRGYNGCTTPYPATATTLPNVNTGDGSTVDHFVYSGGNRGSSVELYRVVGGGHSWPGATANSIGVGNRNLDFNASLVIWQFLSKYCLPKLTSTSCTETPTISSQTNSSTVCSGTATTFSVTASGCVGTALTYQWQVNQGTGFSDLANNSTYSGAKTNILSIASATAGLNNYQFRCFVTSCCNTAYSVNSTLTVENCCIKPTITDSKPNLRCGTGIVTLSATASAGTINWYNAITGGTSIATGTSFTTPSISSTTTYYVDATNNGCTTSSRTAVIATVSAAPTATISGSKTICSGASAILTIALTGKAPWAFTYGSATASNPITAITTPSYTTSVTPGTYTLASVSDANCAGTVSGTATITENKAITITNKTEACNGSNTEYTVEFDIVGGNAGSYTVNGNTTGIINNHYKGSALAAATTYSLTVSDSYNCAPITVSGKPTCSVTCNATAVISESKTICAGTAATINITLTGATPWSITYAIDGVNQTPVTAQIPTYTFTTTKTGVYTLASVKDANNCIATTSGSATITENKAITITNKTEACNGSNTEYTVEFDIVGGNAGSYTVNGNTTGIINNHYKGTALAAATTYSLTVSDSYNCAPVTVSGKPTCSVTCNATAVISESKTICAGIAATINITLTGATPWSITYAIDGVNQTPVTAQIPTYTFTTTKTGVYTLASVKDANNCIATTSGSATITENKAITITNKTEACNGSNTEYTVEFDIVGGNAGSYTVNGNTTGIINNHYKGSALASGTSYSLTVNDSYNCTPVTVSGTPTCSVTCNATASMNGATTICSGTTISIVLTGKSPWSITYTIDAAVQSTITSITTSPYTLATTKAGVYRLTSVNDANNCVATLSGNTFVKVNAGPTITTTALPSSANVCSGGSVTLSGKGASSYTWTGGIKNGVSFIPAKTETFTVTGIDSITNCTSSTIRVVTVLNLPAVGIIANPAIASICAGAKVTLTATGANSYVWSDGGTLATVSYTPTATKTYTVTGTATNTCSNKATKTVIVGGECTVGIEENMMNNSISIFPNPTDGLVNIKITNTTSKDISIIVYNMLGAEVYTSNDKNNATEYFKQINLNTLDKGVYYFKFKTGNEVTIKKLIIQ